MKNKNKKDQFPMFDNLKYLLENRQNKQQDETEIIFT